MIVSLVNASGTVTLAITRKNTLASFNVNGLPTRIKDDDVLPLLAGICCVGVCAWARVSAAPRHSWLGCWGLCVFVCALLLSPMNPGWGVRCGCVCLCSDFGCAPPFLAGVLGCLCVDVRALLVPRQSWLGCAVWVCVLGLEFRLHPATPCWSVWVCVSVCTLCLYPDFPGWGVRVCVCLCACSSRTPPFLAVVCVVGVCPLARVAAVPRHFWLGFGVCVCVRVRALLVKCHSWLGCAVWVCVLVLRFRLRPATPGWGVGVCVSVCILCL